MNLLDVSNGCSSVLVEAEHPYIKSYIKHIHISNNCCGANATLNNVKWKLHGFGIRKIVKEEVRGCLRCAITRAHPYHYPTQPEIPLERLQLKETLQLSAPATAVQRITHRQLAVV